MTPLLSLSLAAVNYHHWGDAKRWYGVPSAAAAAFEQAFKAALPEQFDRQPDLLFHLTAMLSPRVLLEHNVPVFGVTQVSCLAAFSLSSPSLSGLEVLDDASYLKRSRQSFCATRHRCDDVPRHCSGRQ